MGNLTPAQMFDHSLVVIKGPSLLNRLDFFTELQASEVILAGGLCSVNSAGRLVSGCSNGLFYNRPMPLFAIQNYDDYDVNSDVGNFAGGVLSTVVATGGFEIETTEFVAGTYRPNDFVTPGLAADKGKVRKATRGPYSSQPMCGMVSTGQSTNEYKKDTLRFWTMFLPSADHVTESSSSVSSVSSSSSSIVTRSTSSSQSTISSVSSSSSSSRGLSSSSSSSSSRGLSSSSSSSRGLSSSSSSSVVTYSSSSSSSRGLSSASSSSNSSSSSSSFGLTSSSSNSSSSDSSASSESSGSSTSQSSQG